MKIQMLFSAFFFLSGVYALSAQTLEQEIKTIVQQEVEKVRAEMKAQAVPIGCVQAYAGDKIPTGWVECNGQEYNKTKYPELYKAIGTSWGGSGDMFRVPDLRGQFLRGVSGTQTTDPNSEGRTAKYSGGNSGNQVGSYQDDATALPNKELILKAEKAGSHSHAWGGTGWGAGDKYDSGHGRVDANTPKHRWPTSQDGEHEHNVRVIGGGDAETRPKNANVIFIIRVE